jgi:hypothetical protein
MTSTTQGYSAAASRSASTVEKIADFWTQGSQRLSDYMLPGLPQVDLVPLVERYFEFVQRTVDISRDFTLKWAEAAGTQHHIQVRAGPRPDPHDRLLRAVRADWAAAPGCARTTWPPAKRRAHHRSRLHLARTPPQAALPPGGQEPRLAQAPDRGAEPAQPGLPGWLRCSSAAMVWLSSFQLFSNLARPSRSSCSVTSSKSTPTAAS